MDETAACSCTALRKASRPVSQLYDAALAPCGLRTTQRAILNHIHRAGTPQIGELAEALVMDRGALTHNLKPLERDGLVAVTVDPKDRRNRLITLTAAGQAKLAESEVLWSAAQRGFRDRIRRGGDEIPQGGIRLHRIRRLRRCLSEGGRIGCDSRKSSPFATGSPMLPAAFDLDGETSMAPPVTIYGIKNCDTMKKATDLARR
ncbi:MAG: MarR family transcriptional regulator [Aliidongia sp.]